MQRPIVIRLHEIVRYILSDPLRSMEQLVMNLKKGRHTDASKIEIEFFHPDYSTHTADLTDPANALAYAKRESHVVVFFTVEEDLYNVKVPVQIASDTADMYSAGFVVGLIEWLSFGARV
jgi:hypothetical protein